MNKASDPAVSIIIPVYNMEPYLKGCISSALRQTFPSFELILVNDGSTDGSLEICRQACRKDDRVILLSDADRQGVSHARNAGIEASAGKYLFFMDADDQIHPQYLEQLWLQAEKSDSDLVITDRLASDVTDKKTWREFCRHPYNPQWVIWKDDDLWDHWYQIRGRDAVWAKLFRRDSIQDLRFDERMHVAEDTLFNDIYLRAKPRQISHTDSPGYYYRIRKDSSCRNLSLNDYMPCIQIKEAIRDRELSLGHRDYAYILERNNVFQMRQWLYENRDNKAEIKQMQEMLEKERHDPLLSDLSWRQKIELFLTCYCLPLNNFLMQMKRTLHQLQTT